MTRSESSPPDAPPMTVALALESDGPGGAEWMLIHLAVGLRERGLGVVPILPERGVGWLGSELEARGFAARTFRLDHPLDAGCVLRLRRLLIEEKVSVVHAHEFTMSVFATAAGRLCGVPSVVTFHSAQAFPERLRRRIATRWAVRQASAATTVSAATRTQLVDRLGTPADTWIVIPNGVPVPRGDRAAARAALGIGPDERLLLAVGNLYAVKGHDVLLRAVARIAERTDLSPWVLAIAGRGQELEPLQVLAGALGITSRVRFLGFRQDVASLLHAADLFVHPSRSEGLPLAIVEAMSVGLPVVASDVGGIPEVVRSGETGLLVPPEDAEALAEATVRLFDDPAEAARMGARGREVAAEAYGLEAMMDRYLALYRAAGGAR